MSRKIGLIYIHKNLKNNKVYIGQTWQNPTSRWKKTNSKFSAHKNCKALYNALLKYSWESFETTILKVAKTKKQIDLWEEFYIKLFNSNNSDFGYNIKSYCNGRPKQADSTKDKIRQKAIGRKCGNPWNKTPIENIDGIDYKLCTQCKEKRTLDKFLKCRGYYNYRCRDCKNAYYRGTIRYKRISKKAKKASFKARGEKFKLIHGTPEKRLFFKKLNAKSILQIDMITNQIIKEYSCAKDAKIDGFLGPGISTAIKTNGHYKGYIWRFKNA